jgi:hypothetical protein
LNCRLPLSSCFLCHPKLRQFDCFACHLLSRWFLARLILQPWGWRRHIPPKRRLTSNGLHGVIYQKREPFKSEVYN